jgi:hypothetical protein
MYAEQKLIIQIITIKDTLPNLRMISISKKQDILQISINSDWPAYTFFIFPLVLALSDQYTLKRRQNVIIRETCF